MRIGRPFELRRTLACAAARLRDNLVRYGLALALVNAVILLSVSGQALAETRILALGGAASEAAIAEMKQALVISNRQRLKAIEEGRTAVIGVNMFQASEPSPLSATEGGAILTVSDHVEYEQIEKLKAWRSARDRSMTASQRWPMTSS